jgi:uncharacterized protein involved in type VI secretion and phage assembly
MTLSHGGRVAGCHAERTARVPRRRQPVRAHGPDAGSVQFRAELVPSVWLLTHRYKSRIFQNKTVQDIINDVLTQAGFASDRFRFELSGTYAEREYCVQ